MFKLKCVSTLLPFIFVSSMCYVIGASCGRSMCCVLPKNVGDCCDKAQCCQRQTYDDNIRGNTGC